MGEVDVGVMYEVDKVDAVDCSGFDDVVTEVWCCVVFCARSCELSCTLDSVVSC